MIVPVPETFFRISDRPMIWVLVILNVLIQVMVSSVPQINDMPWGDESLLTAGHLYFRDLKEQGEQSFRRQPEWLRVLQEDNQSHMEFLGSLAIRKMDFVKKILDPTFVANGDQVAIKRLREDLKKREQISEEDYVSRLGLSAANKGTLSWVTYQFSHAGWIHLISNLIFLILIGSAVETQLGSLGLFLMYLAGGWFGGMFFLWVQPQSLVPVVGASGAVSALMAFYAFFEPRRMVRYFYLILPVEGHMGFIYMSPLFIAPLYLFSDFASLFASPELWTTGVAYSAHVGGAILGATMALWLRFVLRWRPLSMST